MVDVITTATDRNLLINQANSTTSSSSILQAIKSASDKTGVDFTYLLKKACQESSLDPTAKATTSSARGLYQFTQQTWLRMVKSQGANYGLSDAASHITIDSNGTAHVDSKAWKTAILNLRNDPTVSSEMAAELDKQNMTALKSEVGGKVGGTELYLAHFLGASGACDFLNTMKDAPNTAAAEVLPTAASANSSVFYKADGTPRTLSEIYHNFAQKFSNAGTAVANIIHNVTTASATATTATTSGVATASAYHMPHNLVASAGDVLGTTSSVLGTATMGSTAVSNYAPVTNGNIQTGSSSLYATMVLAQMNSDGLKSLSALSGLQNIGVSQYSNSTKSTDKKALAGILGNGYAG